jgi:hypothetical protein
MDQIFYQGVVGDTASILEKGGQYRRAIILLRILIILHNGISI